MKRKKTHTYIQTWLCCLQKNRVYEDGATVDDDIYTSNHNGIYSHEMMKYAYCADASMIDHLLDIFDHIVCVDITFHLYDNIF